LGRGHCRGVIAPISETPRANLEKFNLTSLLQQAYDWAKDCFALAGEMCQQVHRHAHSLSVMDMQRGQRKSIYPTSASERSGYCERQPRTRGKSLTVPKRASVRSPGVVGPERATSRSAVGPSREVGPTPRRLARHNI
jgi:hypothetical protein